MTLQEAKDQAVKQYGYADWWAEDLTFPTIGDLEVYNRFGELMYEAGKKEKLSWDEGYEAGIKAAEDRINAAQDEADTFRRALEKQIALDSKDYGPAIEQET